MLSPDDINKNVMNENIEIMNSDVSTITFPEKARAASYNGQISNCGQLNLISGEVERPKTGPGALCWCPCKREIPPERKWNSKFYDTIKCHNRYWVPRMKQIVKANELEKRRLQAEIRTTSANIFITKHPQVMDWLLDKTLEAYLVGGKYPGFRFLWEKAKLEFPEINFNNNDQRTVSRHVMSRDKRLKGFFKTRGER